MKKTLKFLKKTISYFIIFWFIIFAILYLTGNKYFFRAVRLTYLQGNTTSNISDAKDFDVNTIKSSKPQDWELHPNYNKAKLSNEFVKELEKYKTAVFLVIKDGKILQEHYWRPYSEKSLTNSFSMAKSLVTLLAQKAIEDGYINSWEQPITDYLPEYKNDPNAQKCTIADLSKMTSGFNWKEDYYFPLNPTSKAYYGKNMDEVILNRKFIQALDTKWKYLSGNTQLLGYIISRATKKTLSEYLSEKFWKPLGMSQDATWTVDHTGGIEKAYCCVSSCARDFAKFGQLYLQKGNWNGKQLIDSTFLEKATHPNSLSPGVYGYGFWMDYTHKYPFYMMKGHLGQYVICLPKQNAIIVRLGESRTKELGEKNKFLTKDIYLYINEIEKY
ncbi:serine hydrolase [Chryseobacterium gambrini]|uniref:Serine hydrolase n=1 Tax=Chryseobacterium gambrini TaxID=373672 RepID=A0AAJ1R4J0_9FLAO|nr:MULTISPECIES: serine hydrolase [Chryseobacterium]MDN4012925.1 serine hydrolase [Chryseobacterium gambrini]QWA36540.1 beta-lactamase family protein [Chryseobacterium sp. ZHDP1]